MYRIKNTADDRTKHLLHRTASQLELEPSLGGRRIRLGTYYDITPEHYERVKSVIDAWVKKGMVEISNLDTDQLGKWRALEPAVQRLMKETPEFNTDGLKLGGPTLEEWMECSYPAENYPPEGFAEVFSPGLVAYKRAQEEAAEAFKEATPVIDEPPPQAEPPVPEQPIPAPVPVPAVTVIPPAQAPLPIPPAVSSGGAKNKKILR